VLTVQAEWSGTHEQLPFTQFPSQHWAPWPHAPFAGAQHEEAPATVAVQGPAQH
jgi:hypothetical protein